MYGSTVCVHTQLYYRYAGTGYAGTGTHSRNSDFGEETPQKRLDLTSVKEYLKYFGVRV